MTSILIRLALICVTVCFANSVAVGGIVLTFSVDDGVTFADSLTVPVGATSSIGIYLSDDDPNGLLATEGLFGFALSLSSSSTSFVSIDGATISTPFDAVFADTSTAGTISWDAAVLNNSPPVMSKIHLGIIQLNGVRDGTTTLTFSDPEPGSTTITANWLTPASTVLDQAVFGIGGNDTVSLTIESATSVPEPCGGACLLLLTLLLGARRYLPSRSATLAHTQG